MNLFVARCIAVPSGFEDSYTATMVAQADTPEALTTRARVSLEARGHRFLRLEDIKSAQTHLRVHGETELIAALTAAVSDEDPVQLSRFRPLGAARESTSSDPVLMIERHALSTLDPDDKAPFWERPWCPPELAELLFTGTKRTYAVIDSAKRTELRGGFDMDAVEMIAETACLYSGDAAQEMSEVAPYLVELTPFGEDGALVPAPLRDLFSRQWSGGACLIMRIDADIQTLRKHLRHFVQIRSSEDAETWTYFRFWDPATARIYFPGIATRPERVDRIFRAGPELALEVIAPDGTDALHLFPRAPKGPTHGQKPITFDAQDHILMQRVADEIFNEETAHWLRDAYPDRFADFEEPQMDLAVAHIMSEGARLGCERKDDYVYLAHMMLTLGGWFAVAGHPAPLVDILTDGQAGLRVRLSRAFVPAFEATPQAALMRDWEGVRSHISALPEPAQITPEEFGAFTARFLQNSGAETDAALAATKRDLAGLDLPLATQGRLLILTLIYGHRFYADPLRIWAATPVAEVVDAIWSDLFAES